MTERTPDFLPYGRHSIDEDDIAAVGAVLRGEWLTTGPAVQRFEQALAEAVGARHAVACSSGTAALHLALLAAGVTTGDAVIVPSLTFLATANAGQYLGAEILFADVDPDSGLMEEDHLAEAFDRAGLQGLRVTAVLPVHLNGQCADLPALYRQAKDRGAKLLADSCHALGTTYDTPEGMARVGDGRHSDLDAFSFHPVKTIAMGEGGAVTTSDATMAARMARLRNHGINCDPKGFRIAAQGFDGNEPNPWYYEMAEIGFNYRASDIHCALGLSQLSKLDRFVARRRALARRYDERLRPLANLVRPVARAPGCTPAWHLYAVLIDFDAIRRSRRQVMQALAERGIGTQVHYLPVHRQPYYRERYGTLSLPGADEYYRRVLSLPLFPAMETADVDRVVEALAGVLRDG